MNDLVSVCIPVFNGGRFIEETLLSLIAQTYRKVEIIVSDNASTDQTVSIATRMQERDKRIRLIRNSENVGYTKNIWNAVSAATSDFVAIYHADDLYERQIVEREYGILSLHPEVDGVFSKCAVFRSDPQKLDTRYSYSNIHTKKLKIEGGNAIAGGLHEFLPIILQHGNVFACSSFMTRKSVFQEIGGFTENYPSNEDLELWLKYLLGGHKLAILNDFLLHYRMSSFNASAYWSRAPQLPAKYQVISEMIVSKLQLSPDELSRYQTNLASGYLFCALNAFLQGKMDLMEESIAMSKETKRLAFCTKYGFVQAFPALFFRIKRALLEIK
jgi:glycosyltransferase involved in cell wall biosynthesis